MRGVFRHLHVFEEQTFVRLTHILVERKKPIMRKLKYAAPELNIVALEAADIITTSTDAFEGEWVPIGGGSIEDDLLF